MEHFVIQDHVNVVIYTFNVRNEEDELVYPEECIEINTMLQNLITFEHLVFHVDITNLIRIITVQAANYDFGANVRILIIVTFYNINDVGLEASSTKSFNVQYFHYPYMTVGDVNNVIIDLNQQIMILINQHHDQYGFRSRGIEVNVVEVTMPRCGIRGKVKGPKVVAMIGKEPLKNKNKIQTTTGSSNTKKVQTEGPYLRSTVKKGLVTKSFKKKVFFKLKKRPKAKKVFITFEVPRRQRMRKNINLAIVKTRNLTRKLSRVIKAKSLVVKKNTIDCNLAKMLGQKRVNSVGAGVPTPKVIRKYVLNTEKDDNRCFLWTLLAALDERTHHKRYDFEADPKYDKLKELLLLNEIKFPIEFVEINKFMADAKFEKDQVRIFKFFIGFEIDDGTGNKKLKYFPSVNDRRLIKELANTNDSVKCRFDLIYQSEKAINEPYDSDRIVNMLCLDNHMVLIKDLSKLVDRLFSTSKKGLYFCEKCVSYTTYSKPWFKQHKLFCDDVRFVLRKDKAGNAKLIYGSPRTRMLKLFTLPFNISCDFEAINSKFDGKVASGMHTWLLSEQKEVVVGLHFDFFGTNIVHLFAGEKCTQRFVDYSALVGKIATYLASSYALMYDGEKDELFEECEYCMTEIITKGKRNKVINVEWNKKLIVNEDDFINITKSLIEGKMYLTKISKKSQNVVYNEYEYDFVKNYIEKNKDRKQDFIHTDRVKLNRRSKDYEIDLEEICKKPLFLHEKCLHKLIQKVFIPTFWFHNGRGYDFHYLVDEIVKSHYELQVIPLTNEKYLVRFN